MNQIEEFHAEVEDALMDVLVLMSTLDYCCGLLSECQGSGAEAQMNQICNLFYVLNCFSERVCVVVQDVLEKQAKLNFERYAQN